MEKVAQVDYENIAYKRMSPFWTMCETFLGGTAAVKDSDFLYKYDSETATSHTNRQAESEFYNVFASTISQETGVVFQNSINPEEIPTALEPLFNNVDLCGNDMSSFLRKVYQKGTTCGHTFIYVDAPPAVEVENPTFKDVEEQRPYFVHYSPGQVINWRFTTINGRVMPSQVTILESVIEEDGDFGEKQVDYYKTIRRGLHPVLSNQTNASFTKRKKKEKEDTTGDDFEIVGEANIPLSTVEIPLVPFYGNYKAPFESQPPYIDLAYLNITHYNRQSRLDKALSYAVPMAVFTVPTEEDAGKLGKLLAASENGIALYGENASANYLELKGDSVPAMERQIEKIEVRMSKIGHEKFAPIEDNSQKTAFEIGSDNRKEMSEITVRALNLENCVSQCLGFAIEIYKAIKRDSAIKITDEERANLKLNIQYDKLTFNSSQLERLESLSISSIISRETVREVLPNFYEMPEGWTKEIEAERVRNQSQNDFPEI